MIKITSRSFVFTSMALAITAALDVAAQPMLEEVIVTATKREASMQDVPIAISMMNGEKIMEQGIQSLEELAIFMPNVHIAEGGAGDQLFIRGVGSGINYGFEQSVGTFIDGVYFGRGQASRSTFLDIERVEVLKGPQSTLFGKNTVAGAINITTRRPTDEFEGVVEATLEPEFDGWSTTLTLSGPLNDNFGARLVLKQEETDGYMSNTFTGDDERTVENTVGRLVLAWTPSDSLDVTLKYETGETKARGRQDVVSIATDFAVGRYQAADPNFSAGFGYDKSSKNIGGVRPDTDVHDSEWNIVTLTAEWLVGEHSIKSITGYVDYEFSNYLDSDYGPLAFLGRGRDEKHEQFTQEFLLSSPTGGTIEYLAGLYYQSEELEHERYTDAVLSAAGIGTGSLDASGLGNFEQDAETLSAFTQLTWHISDSFRAIGGLRYSADEKEMTKDAFVTDLFTDTPNNQLAGIYDQVLNFSTDHFMGPDGATVCEGVAYVCTDYPDFDNERTESHWTGDVTLQWDATDEIMTYFKVGNGYKAGGFDEANGRGLIDAQEYGDETVLSYELGAKLDLLDGRARMTFAAFQSEFEDLQVSAFDGNAGFIVGNAAESEVKGLEVDGMLAITDELTFMASLAYLDASYTSFEDAACNEPQVQEFIAAGGARADCLQDLSGEALQFSPEWSAHIGLDYATQLGSNMELRMGLDAMYSDAYEVANDLDPAVAQGSFSKINARIALLSLEDTWSVAVLGKNLTDEATTTWGNDVPLAGQGFSETYFQHIDAPRSYELQVRYRF
ncbi:TonB-dependent receptor [Halieaceae bacterium IMCC14734]|uniref:TonB-dependent receptor n=1 Tax=Candidatus Litorirhabdus singularis TaxID=2518993 RepID=A0ABT3TEL8_9GAMM|nr:TonB-dependent receptor [Candidatus Litorirhabdus singularis]MCX2980694.1 TonB-dependent receptor [Candidatus Litorirhabdus singularis]